MLIDYILAHEYLLLDSTLGNLRKCLPMDILCVDSRLETLIARDSLRSHIMGSCPSNPALSLSTSVSFLDSLLKLVKHSIRIVQASCCMDRIVGSREILRSTRLISDVWQK